MGKQATIALLISLCTALSAAPALSGAWLKPQGRGEIILNGVYFTSDGFWDKDGNESSQPTFKKHEINPYLEYGFSEEITLGANVFLHHLSQEAAAGSGANAASNFGLGNSEFFARYGLFRSDASTLALQPLIALPSLYDEQGAPRSGSESLDAELSLLGGHNFQWLGRSHYAEARVGYRHRFDNELSDQMRFDVKAGLRLSEHFELIPAAYSIWSLAGSKNPVFTEDGQQDFDLVKIEAMLRYNLSDRAYVQGGGFSHVYGRNVGDGSGLMLSFGRHF